MIELVRPAMLTADQIPVPTPKPDQTLGRFQIELGALPHFHMLLEREVGGDGWKE
jgi:hypothetical protein